MSLKTVMNQAAKQTFSLLDSVLEPVTYNSKGEDAYDTTTGKVETQGGTTYNFKASLTSYKDHEIDYKVVQPKDRRCIFLVRDLPIEPKLIDTITTSEGDWDIIAAKREFTRSVITLQIRRP